MEKISYKGFIATEHDDGYTIEGCVWFFSTFDLVKDYIDSHKNGEIKPTDTGAMAYLRTILKET